MTDRQAITRIIKDPYHCAHPSVELRARQHSNHSMHYVDQCLTCGAQIKSYRRNSNEVARLRLTYPGNTLPEFDDELGDRFFSRGRQEHKARRDMNKAEWDAWYTEYLQTPKWRAKRAEIMRRDRFTCQGCHGRATLVHHLDYSNVGDELLFQLLALCDDCHDRVHQAAK